ncbi:hypothetical protein [Treponema putidum]|uniref:hypothetical protein n=1 Tax=Treponema putidum TaxID=221027 RepID=UPI003D8CD8F4
MEFDKSRVYTAVNADELKSGSKCLFADTVKALRKKVENENAADDIRTFIRLLDDGGDVQFVADHYAYNYAYLIEPPDEPKYKPFESIDKAMEAIKKHGGWVKWKDDDIQGLVVGKSDDRVKILEDWVLPEELFEGFVFADDGSPCGELVEE